MKSIIFGSVSLGLILGLAAGVIAANPKQVNQLRETNKCHGCDFNWGRFDRG